VHQDGQVRTEEQSAPVEIPFDAVHFLPIAAGAVRSVTAIDSRRAFVTVEQSKLRRRLDTVLVNLP
jgi:hypothetical protein